MGRESAGDKVTPLNVTGYRADKNGNVTVTKVFDTQRNGINVYEYFASGSSLAWNTNTNSLGWMLSRTMVQSGDGNNHQSCIAVILDASTLDIISIQNEISRHSWNNYIDTYEADRKDFLAVDLGDHFPRGIHVHRINNETHTSKVRVCKRMSEMK